MLALRGEALRRLGRYDEALSVLDDALELAPGDAEIRALREGVEAERAASSGRKT
ncbi:MAG: tetratricopeptide repeat protein [Myxococcota bacterium]